MAKVEIDLLDTSLDNSGDGDHEILGMVDDGSFGSGGDDKSHMAKFMDSGEDDVTYNYKNPSGTVTYRLVHVGGDEGGGGNEGVTGVPAPLHYSPSTGPDGGTAQSLQTMIANSVNGHLYVIGNSEVFAGNINKPIIPRETHSKGPSMKKRDDRRRMTHNEVERRRRDKINSWIVRLAKLMPPSMDTGEKCNGEVQSKGGILAKACEYINELKEKESRLDEVVKDKDRLNCELVTLSMRLSSLERSNQLLRNQLTRNGIVPNTESPDVS